MVRLHEEYVIDEKGEKKGVLLKYSEWIQLMEELEELEEIRIYDQIKKEPTDPIPFDKAIQEINNK